MKKITDWFGLLENGLLIDSGEKGPTSVIIAGIHGNEPCGVEAFLEVVPNLHIEHGKVIFVLGNPKALRENKRSTELNLNRAFRPSRFYNKKQKSTYEYKRAQFLKKIFLKGDVALDIHSTRNPGKPFIICEKSGYGIVQNFSKTFVRIVGGFGGVEPGATDDFMGDNGKIGIGVECGQHNSPMAKEVAKSAIQAFLESRGHIKPTKKLKSLKREIIHIHSIHITKENFIPSRKFKDFEKASKGTLLGTDGNTKITLKKDSIILFLHECKTPGEEAFLLAKKVK